jgi:hypothetical protein
LSFRCGQSSAGASCEPIANADHRFNAVAALTQLLPQPSYVNVQGARIAIVTVAPNSIEKLLSSDNAICALRQNGKKRELLVR